MDLLITPSGYTFSIWSVIYVLSIVVCVALVAHHQTGVQAGTRIVVDLSIAFAGATTWILFSAAEWTWITSIVLTVMTLVLLDAARLAAGPDDASGHSMIRTLVRVLIGIYAARATAAVFQNWASDIGTAGADPTALGWQLTILILGAIVGIVVTGLVGATLPFYPLTLIWALTGIVVAAWSVTIEVVIACLVAIVLVIAAYLASRNRTALV